jgi:hypothetical protein
VITTNNANLKTIIQFFNKWNQKKKLNKKMVKLLEDKIKKKSIKKGSKKINQTC